MTWIILAAGSGRILSPRRDRVRFRDVIGVRRLGFPVLTLLALIPVIFFVRNGEPLALLAALDVVILAACVGGMFGALTAPESNSSGRASAG